MAVETHAPTGERGLSIITNGKNDSDTFFDHMTTVLIGILPAMMADKAERAFVVGWGTGITVGELAALDSMKRVDVAEFSRGIIEAAPLFDFANRSASKNPKVHVMQSDAYRALMRSDELYDVIAAEPSNPWVTGVEMLYSKEFLEVAKSRLAEGGVYAQWLHLYETDDETIELILRTYADVFEHVTAWSLSYQDILLLGLQKPGPALDHYRFEARSQEADFKEALNRIDIDTFPQLLAHELLPVGVLHQSELEGPIHTLYHPRLSDTAGRAFFRGEVGHLPFSGTGALPEIARSNSMVGGYGLRFGGHLPDEARSEMIRETFRTLGPLTETLMAEWASENPDSEVYEETRRWAKENLQSYSQDGKSDSDSDVGLARVDRLALLFAGPGHLSEEAIDLKTAQQAQEDYATFYHHSAPFSPEALLRIWGRCRGEQQTYERCEQVARSQLELSEDRDFNMILEECMQERALTPQCVEGLKQAREFLSGRDRNSSALR